MCFGLRGVLVILDCVKGFHNWVCWSLGVIIKVHECHIIVSTSKLVEPLVFEEGDLQFFGLVQFGSATCWSLCGQVHRAQCFFQVCLPLCYKLQTWWYQSLWCISRHLGATMGLGRDVPVFLEVWVVKKTCACSLSCFVLGGIVGVSQPEEHSLVSFKELFYHTSWCFCIFWFCLGRGTLPHIVTWS